MTMLFKKKFHKENTDHTVKYGNEVMVLNFSQYRYLALIALVFVSSFFLLIDTDRLQFMQNPNPLYTASNDFNKNIDSFTIKTEGCTIPGMEPFSEEVKRYVAYPSEMKPCPHSNSSLLASNKTHIWVKWDNIQYYNVTKGEELSCCYTPFYRPNRVEDVSSMQVDDRVTYKECNKFIDSVLVKDEFVKASCNFKGREVYAQYFIFALKKDIRLYDDHKEFSQDKSGYNVLILGIDASSRMNFHRTMPKTLEYIKKKGAVELMGYNKVGDNSFPNLVPFLMGYSQDEINRICYPFLGASFDHCPFIWNLYKEAGYYTAFGEDTSSLGTFNYLMSGFMGTPPTDYYPHTFMHQAERTVGTNKDFNSNLCMNDKFFFKVLLDYTEDVIASVYPHKLFAFFWEVTMSHDYLNYPMVMDENYKMFFQKLYDIKYLDDSIIFLVSDHGIRWGDIRSTKQGRLEERLPFVYIIPPPSLRENYSDAYNNLIQNSRRLSTPYDIHATLQDLVDLKNIENDKILSRSKKQYANNRSISLFLPIPPNRTCEMAEIGDHFCTCHRDKKISTDSDEAKAAAKHLVEHLNSLLREHPVCARLSVQRVMNANEMVVNWLKVDETDVREFLMVVQTTPGDGVFEATLRLIDQKWTIVGTVSRLNLYGNQSRCIQNPQLKLYCYCCKSCR